MPAEGQLDTNPIKKARELLGLSLVQLENAAGVHRQVIIRTEQGCYERVPPRLLNYLRSRHGDCDVTDPNIYRRWVDSKRVDSYGQLSSTLPYFTLGIHPFIAWRDKTGLNRISVCRHFCVHPSTLARFETKLVQQSVPEQLSEALFTSGYSTGLLNELSIRYLIYREYQLALHANDAPRINKAIARYDQHISNRLELDSAVGL